MDVLAGAELDAQYRVLREGAGLLARRGRRSFAVHGPEAAEYLQGQLTNEIETLEPGRGCYAALLDRKGHMQADMRVLRVSPEEFWIDTEAVAGDAVLRHLSLYRVGREVEVEDLSAERAILSLIGPAATEVAGTGPVGSEHAHRETAIEGISTRVVATDLGLDLIAAQADGDALARTIADRGAELVSEEAAEVIRVESGRPRYGAEMSSATIPQEAGINERAVSFTKGCYIGQETVARLHYKGKPNRHLRGLRLERSASAGDAVFLGDRELGRVGTAVLSPAQGPIALAILRRQAEAGARVRVGETNQAEVVELPF